MGRAAPFGPPTLWEKIGLSALAAALVIFGGIIEYRSAFSASRKTDLTVFTRAAWMARQGDSLYEFTIRHYHYNNPPLFAVLMVPLANAPSGSEALTLPFAVSVSLWYLLNLLFMGGAVHLVAAALDAVSPDPEVRTMPAFCRRWWLVRIVPLLACSPGILRTLALGQVDLLVLLLLSVTAAAALRGRSALAGLALAAAAALKLIPAFLLLWPLYRRDRRWLMSFAAGLVIFLGLIPATAFGPRGAWQQTRRWAEVVMLPGVGLGSDRSRDHDLIGLASANSQSLLGVFHNLRYPDREMRPDRPDRDIRLLAWGLGGTLALLVLAAAARRRQEPTTPVIAFGALVMTMLLLVPTCHPHYSCHWLILTTALTATSLERHGQRGVGARLVGLCAFALAANGLTSLPGLEPLRDFGLATLAALALWLAGVVSLVGWPRFQVNFPARSALLKG
jgi:alpha-1,2-mannosyltransferase